MKVRCTRSQDGRFKVGKIYPVDVNGAIIDEGGNATTNCLTDSFENWYQRGGWADYDFELVKESKMFTKGDIRSGDKVVTTDSDRGIVVDVNGTLVLVYQSGAFDRVFILHDETFAKVIRPNDYSDVAKNNFDDGTVILDREKGIGCKPPTKEISVSEAEKVLTEKYGKSVRIRVGADG